MEQPKCKLCGNGRYAPFAKVKGYALVRCLGCGLVFLNPMPSPEEIGELYAPAYQTDKLFREEKITREFIETEIGKNDGRAKEITECFGGPGRLLDVGCGSGFFMASMKRRGWDVKGIDISEWAAEFAWKNLGLKVHTGGFDCINPDEKFDVVTMFHLLEHLTDPFAYLRGAARVLSENGRLVIKGPNLESFDRIWHGKEWRGYDVPFHLYFFTPGSYNGFLKKAGFRAERVTFQYWNAADHFLEMGPDGPRADHAPIALAGGKAGNIFIRTARKASHAAAKAFGLKGRDLTICAVKDGKI